MVRDHSKENFIRYQNTGTHWGETALQMNFPEGELMIGNVDVESIVIPLKFFVTISRKKLLSQFELEGRGRAYSFEPIEDFEDGKSLEVHLVHKL
jgi:hypothetical protein